MTSLLFRSDDINHAGLNFTEDFANGMVFLGMDGSMILWSICSEIRVPDTPQDK
jgi:hypothetical protein